MTGVISQTRLLRRLLSLMELGVLGKGDTHVKWSAAGFVVLAGPPTSPLHAKHPTREGRKDLSHAPGQTPNLTL